MGSTVSLSMSGSDVRCPVCGQGFLLYSEERTQQARAWEHDVVKEQLRLHHELQIPHPVEPFPINAEQEPTTRRNGRSSVLHPLLDPSFAA